MGLHDLLHNGQAQADAFARTLGGEKGVEYLLFHLIRDTGAVVRHPEGDTRPVGGGGNPHHAPLRGQGLKGVEHQVEGQLE